jgi:hypothetical protein
VLLSHLMVSTPRPAPPLVEDPGTLWLRVPVGGSDLNNVDRTQPALVSRLDRGIQAQAFSPLLMPLTNPVENNAELYYAVDPALHGLTAGQRVMVELSLIGAPRKVIPYSAVLYDLGGDAFVYTSPEPRVFVRQPIGIDHIDGSRAVLTQGPAAGSAVVTVGGPQLFGVEFGVGK